MIQYDTLVTSYVDPDLDGTACAYAYAELLRQLGPQQVQCALSGIPHVEAKYVLEYCKAKVGSLKKDYSQLSDIILVDASDKKAIDTQIHPSQVIEIIDHRIVNGAKAFPHAKVQIELVGAAATLVYERFITANITPSKESATLLYGAIASNTINFKARVTTKRDIDAAKSLKDLAEIPDRFVYDMFKHKSKIDDLDKAFASEFTYLPYAGGNMGIVQIEITKPLAYVTTNHTKILASLALLQEKKQMVTAFLTCIDIIDGYNVIVSSDSKVQSLLSSCLSTKFENNIAITSKIFMRKEILPLLRIEILKQRKNK